MFKWMKAKRPPQDSQVFEGLDFSDPNQQKFAASLSSWRQSLDELRVQDRKLDQNALNYMSPESLAQLKETESTRRKEAASKKRAANLKAKAKAEKAKQADLASKKPSVKSGAGKEKPTDSKPLKPKTAQKAGAEKAQKPATKKPAVSKPKVAQKSAPKKTTKLPAKQTKAK